VLIGTGDLHGRREPEEHRGEDGNEQGERQRGGVDDEFTGAWQGGRIPKPQSPDAPPGECAADSAAGYREDEAFR
jgi:hypothetical protein